MGTIGIRPIITEPSNAYASKMATLGEILGNPAYNGVYWLVGDPPAASAATAAPAGIPITQLKPRAEPIPAGADIRHLDARLYPNKEGLLAAIGQALDFPAYYGKNWDALEECLNDLSWLTGPVIVQIEHADALEPSTMVTLKDIWAEAAATWAKAGRSFVLLRAGGEEAASGG